MRFVKELGSRISLCICDSSKIASVQARERFAFHAVIARTFRSKTKRNIVFTVVIPKSNVIEDPIPFRVLDDSVAG